MWRLVAAPPVWEVLILTQQVWVHEQVLSLPQVRLASQQHVYRGHGPALCCNWCALFASFQPRCSRFSPDAVTGSNSFSDSVALAFAPHGVMTSAAIAAQLPQMAMNERGREVRRA